MKDLSELHDCLRHWFCGTQGLAVSKTFVHTLKPFQEILHGENVLQLGSFENHILLDALMYQHKWDVSPSVLSSESSLYADFRRLPFEKHSMDAILSPLSLNIFDAACWPLDELDYILKPMGYMVIFTINPYSLWGWALKLGLLPCFSGHRHAAMPIFKLKKALEHRGYTQFHLEYFYYLPPLKNPIWLQYLSFLNQMGKMLPISPASFYLLIIQKYEPPFPDLMIEPVQNTALLSSFF